MVNQNIFLIFQWIFNTFTVLADITDKIVKWESERLFYYAALLQQLMVLINFRN